MSAPKPNRETEVHILYVVHLEKEVPDGHMDGATFKVHTKADADAIIAFARQHGYAVDMARESTSILLDEIPKDCDDA